MAETTTATRGQFARVARTISITCRIAAAFPTEVPPNFITSVLGIGLISRNKKRGSGDPRLVALCLCSDYPAKTKASDGGGVVRRVVMVLSSRGYILRIHF